MVEQLSAVGPGKRGTRNRTAQVRSPQRPNRAVASHKRRRPADGRLAFTKLQ
jgi:hypothetical protein